MGICTSHDHSSCAVLEAPADGGSDTHLGACHMQGWVWVEPEPAGRRGAAVWLWVLPCAFCIILGHFIANSAALVSGLVCPKQYNGAGLDISQTGFKPHVTVLGALAPRLVLLQRRRLVTPAVTVLLKCPRLPGPPLSCAPDVRVECWCLIRALLSTCWALAAFSFSPL